MAFDPVLAQMGYVPQGARPKTIIDNGEPGYYQTNGLENLSRALSKFKGDQEAEQQKKMVELQNKATLYKTLRENGYSSSGAHKAVEEYTGKLPNEITSDDSLMTDINIVDPVTGSVKKVGEVPKGSKTFKGFNTGIYEQKRLAKAKEGFDTYMSDANQALVAIDKIEEQAKNIPDYGRGLIPQIGANIDVGLKKFSKDKDMTRYMGVVSQELIPMARKLMEEKGPITEFDVERVEKGLGDTTAPLADKLFLLNELRNKVKQAIEVKSRTAQISQEEFNQTQPEVSEKLNQPTREEAIQELQRRGLIK